MRSDFGRIAIVNRAAPALRFIRAVHDYNREHRTSIETVALHPSVERHALYVRAADSAVDLGDLWSDTTDGRRRAAYLDMARLEWALAESGADAVWPGWGFLAENAELAELCSRLGMTFIGASAQTLRLAGDKLQAKQLARRLGLPVVAWEERLAASVEAALADAATLGYPVMVKARVGGGGRGILRVDSEAQLAASFDRLRQEVHRLFDDSALFVEQWIPDARHVEVQLVADRFGTAWVLGTRDCSVQRRHQKFIEEAPAQGLAPGLDAGLCEDALRFSRAAELTSVGSVEFLVDREGRHFLLEMNARQQVEHAVTELTTGIDLIGLQLHLARGGRLEGAPPLTTGHAIEVRLNAEDAERGFAPAPGTLIGLRVPARSGLRLDAGAGEGDEVRPEFDSMFATVAAHGRTRAEAIACLVRGLDDASIVVDGGMSTRACALHLLQHPDLRRGPVDTQWLDRLAHDGLHVASDDGAIAILQAAVEACDRAFEAERDEFLATAIRQRPVVKADVGRTFELRHRGHPYVAQVFRHGPQHYQVVVDGVRMNVVVERVGTAERMFTYAGRRYRTQSVVHGLTHLVEVGASLHRVSRDEAGIVRAFAPAVVVSVPAKVGARVEEGETLVVLEAMKMETAAVAAASGVVRDVWVLPNAQVGGGTALVRLQQDAPADVASAAGRVVFAGEAAGPAPAGRWRSRARAVVAGLRAFAQALAPPDVEQARDVLAQLRELMLGSDIAPAETARLVEEYRALAERIPQDDPVVRRLEESILEVYADVSALFGRQPSGDDWNDASALSAGQYLLQYLRTLEARGAGLPASFVAALRRALAHFGSDALEVTPALKSRVFWLYRSHLRAADQAVVAQAILERRLRHDADPTASATPEFSELLRRVALVAEDAAPVLTDLARKAQYRFFLQPAFEHDRQATYDVMIAHLADLRRRPDTPDRALRIQELVDCPYPLGTLLAGRFEDASPAQQGVLLEVLTRRYYRIRSLERVELVRVGDRSIVNAEYELDQRRLRLYASHATLASLDEALRVVRDAIAHADDDADVLVDLYVSSGRAAQDPDDVVRAINAALDATHFDRPLRRVVVAVAGGPSEWPASTTAHFTFRSREGGFVEDTLYRGLHPMMGKRLEISRLQRFHIRRLPSVEDVYLFHGVARDNPRDERLFALTEVRDVTSVRDSDGRLLRIPQLERQVMEAVAAIREFQLGRAPEDRLLWNRIVVHLRAPLSLTRKELLAMTRRFVPYAEGLGLALVALVGPMPAPDTGEIRRRILRITNPGGRGLVFKDGDLHDRPVQPLDEYETKVARMRQRGLTYPYEMIRMLTPERTGTQADVPPGEFVEYDLGPDMELTPVDRPRGRNVANIVVGVVRNFTDTCPDGMTRVVVVGDPSREMGSLAEPECRRIIGALALAGRMGVPLEWFALSAGARISMQSGTENMDWIARVLRHIVDFTQRGGEINIVVTGINVGAQPYWNAEATMLMHTRGILVMMPESAMVLTGKMALDYSGSVSAEDNLGIGGYERIMGPNGQAQYWARDLHGALGILLRHYAHTYVVPGERFPRRADTRDPAARDVCRFPHGRAGVADFALVGHALSSEFNPGRKRPFDVRRIMLAVSDQDHPPLERWPGMLDAENSVVWDAHVGGYPVCLLGFESRPLPRLGFVPTDGPDRWTAGTLFPMASKKTARAINAASGNRPLVVLANLSGFDGSPESMRRRQLEFGAEIGRAVVNFVGPIVFVVVSRYHGGAFVVFSKTLHDNMEVAALEGAYASVIGGAPAAAVVFARDVDVRTRQDARVVDAEREMAGADEGTRRRLRSRMAAIARTVRSEKLGQVADEFDRIHSVSRAREVGSLDRIIPARELRPYVIDAVERGMARELERWRASQSTGMMTHS